MINISDVLVFSDIILVIFVEGPLSNFHFLLRYDGHCFSISHGGGNALFQTLNIEH